MPRNDQIERQWRVWMHLAASSTPLSAAGLARQLGVERGTTSRTIRRDLEVLRSIGVPVHEERRGRDQLYSILDDGPPLRLDPATIFALRLGWRSGSRPTWPSTSPPWPTCSRSSSPASPATAPARARS